MPVQWPALKFGPLNLWNIWPTKGMLAVQPKDKTLTENFKGFKHTACEFWPCHNDEEQNCLMCYCPLAWLECGGNYEVIESPKGVYRKDCSNCTLTHGDGGWEYVQEMLKHPMIWLEEE